jgi:hypothetical protein
VVGGVVFFFFCHTNCPPPPPPPHTHTHTRLSLISACATLSPFRGRYRVKTLLAQQEHINPNLMSNLLRAMKPLMAEDLFDPTNAKAADDDS